MFSRFQLLPFDVSVLCNACRRSVPLLLFVNAAGPKRQVACPHCERDVVLHDAW